MKFRNIVGIAGAIVLIYEVGKIVGKIHSTRSFTAKYGKCISDEEITIDLAKGWIVYHIKNKK